MYRTFFILISDGAPNNYPIGYDSTKGVDAFNNNMLYKDNICDVIQGSPTIKDITASISKVTNYKKIGANPTDTTYQNLVSKVFLIAFSSKIIDKEMMGLNGNDTVRIYNTDVPTIYGSFRSGGVVKQENVKAYDAGGADELVKALEDIAKTISVDMAVYDGPAEMK